MHGTAVSFSQLAVAKARAEMGWDGPECLILRREGAHESVATGVNRTVSLCRFPTRISMFPRQSAADSSAQHLIVSLTPRRSSARCANSRAVIREYSAW
jgi:hypothetical protein